MDVLNQIIESKVRNIFYGGEPVEKNKFIQGGEYYRENYLSTLSPEGIKQIGSSIKEFEIFIEGCGWFKCECY